MIIALVIELYPYYIKVVHVYGKTKNFIVR